MNDPEVALDYHELTVHHPSGLRPDDQRLLHGFRPLQWDRKPPQFKTYPGLEVTPLPEELGRREGALDLQGLSRLLFLSAGVVRVAEGPDGPLWFRAAGSAGNLSPLEVYLVTGELAGLPAGVYHYQPVEHGLVRLAPAPSTTPTSLVLTGVPWRTAWKYRERGFRHLYWDAGTMLAQTLAVAEESGLPASVELGFVDDAVSALVGADGVHEMPLAVVPLTGRADLPEPVRAPVGNLARDPVEFPLITQAQRAGSLGTEADVDGWRKVARSYPAEAATAVAPALSHPLETVVRRRGSTRRFDSARSAPGELLMGGMAWSTRAVPGDFLPEGTTLLEHHVGVHAVDGVDPGAYRWGASGLDQPRPGPVRQAVSQLCLGQALGGSGAFTVFHCARLEPVLAALGSRGYRAVHLEAGIVEGRLHLFAFDRDFGATGLTFYDREVSRFFATEAQALLVTAVGAPAYRSRPGGLPRQPARMALR